MKRLGKFKLDEELGWGLSVLIGSWLWPWWSWSWSWSCPWWSWLCSLSLMLLCQQLTPGLQGKCSRFLVVTCGAAGTRVSTEGCPPPAGGLVRPTWKVRAARVRKTTLISFLEWRNNFNNNIYIIYAMLLVTLNCTLLMLRPDWRWHFHLLCQCLNLSFSVLTVALNLLHLPGRFDNAATWSLVLVLTLPELNTNYLLYGTLNLSGFNFITNLFIVVRAVISTWVALSSSQEQEY